MDHRPVRPVGFRKRFFAWVLRQEDDANHEMYGTLKQELFTDLSGTVVEVGPGTGINLRYLPAGTTWLGVEPNSLFHDGLLARAREHKIDARLLTGDAANIPLADGSADAVICTLVLCSVPDQAAAVAEMKRVLKPGGRLLFIEHVAAPNGSMARRVQEWLNPVNRLVADGCNCQRETWTAIENAGFARVELAHRRISGGLKIHERHVVGRAIR